MIVVVSDMHLGYRYSNEGLFRKFVNEIVANPKVEHFILMGDILDMWRRDPLKLLIDYKDIFEKLEEINNSGREVHLVVGNHDYHTIELKEDFQTKYDLDVTMDMILTCGAQGYYFIHGYQFEYPYDLELYQEFANVLCMKDDKTGGELDTLWEFWKVVLSLRRKVPLSKRIRSGVNLKDALLKDALDFPEKRLSEEDLDKIEKEAIKMRENNKSQFDDDYMVYGHTHRPFVDTGNCLANSGSWVSDPDNPSVAKNTYLVIEPGKAPEWKIYPP